MSHDFDYVGGKLRPARKLPIRLRRATSWLMDTIFALTIMGIYMLIVGALFFAWIGLIASY